MFILEDEPPTTLDLGGGKKPRGTAWFVLPAILLGLLVGAVGIYIVRPELFSDPPFQRIVIGSENSADLEEETGEAEIELQPTPEPDDNEDDPADEDSQDAGGEAGAASFAIQPGNWLLTTQFVDISKVDPLDDSFTINRNGVGDFETGAVCVSEAAAQAPAPDGQFG